MAEVLIRLALFLAAGYAVWLLLITWLTIRWLTRPPRRGITWAISRSRPSTPAELHPPRSFQEFTVASHGHTLHCWHISGDAPSAPTLILSHGWGDSRITMLERAAHLAPHFSSILLWDLPGHGSSSGTSSLGAREHIHIPDLIAALPPDPSRAFALYGYSLGAGVSLAAASQWARTLPPLRFLILEAPYRFPITPAANVMRAVGAFLRPNLDLAFLCIGIDLGFGPSFARSPRFDRAAIAASLSDHAAIPVLILHGKDDSVCPIQDARDIAARLRHSTLIELENVGHLTLYSNPMASRQALAAIHTLLQ